MKHVEDPSLAAAEVGLGCMTAAALRWAAFAAFAEHSSGVELVVTNEDLSSNGALAVYLAEVDSGDLSIDKDLAVAEQPCADRKHLAAFAEVR